MIFGLYWLPESPDFLFAKGRFVESRDVLLRIAKFNGKIDIKPEQFCFGGHRQEVYFRGTRDMNLDASLQTPFSSNQMETPSQVNTPGPMTRYTEIE